MTETTQTPEDPAAARAAEQARLRKQRREAKIKAGGSDRLNKITGLGGRPPSDDLPPSSTPTNTAIPAPQATAATPKAHGDPDEVDISQHFYKPNTTNRIPNDGPTMSENRLRQMMLGMDPSGSEPGTPPTNPFMSAPGSGAAPMPGMEGLEGLEEDPIMKMMTQMMSGGMPGAGGAGGANPFAGTPLEGMMAGMAGMAGGGAPGASPFAQAQQAVVQKTVNLWRILHAVFAIGLGLYVALSTTFTGTKAERDNGTIESTGAFGAHSVEETKAYFFYLFTSIEAILLTSRFFVDKNRAPPSGWIWTVSGFLPNPIQGYIRTGMQYGQILGTIRSDALVCVFVMGVCAWLRS